MVKDIAPEQPSVKSLLGLMDEEILERAEQVYQGQYEAALKILPCQCQEQFFWQSSMRIWAGS